MFDRLFAKEETTAALVLALSGSIMVLVAKGNSPLSPDRLLAGVLSNPVPRAGDREAGHGVSTGTPPPSIAA